MKKAKLKLKHKPKLKPKQKQKFCRAKEHRWGRWAEASDSRARVCRNCDTTEIERSEFWW